MELNNVKNCFSAENKKCLRIQKAIFNLEDKLLGLKCSKIPSVNEAKIKKS